MIQQQVYILNTILMAIDAFCIIAAGYGAFYVQIYESGGNWSIETHVFTLSVLLVMFLNNYMMGKYKLYSDVRPSSYFILIMSILKSIAASFGVLAICIVLFQQTLYLYSRVFLLSFTCLSFALIGTFRILAQLYIVRASKKSKFSRKILLVGDLERGKFVNDLLNSQLSWGHKVVGQISVDGQDCIAEGSLGSIEDLPKILQEYTVDEVVFTIKTDSSVPLKPSLAVCKNMGIPVRILPGLWQRNEQSLSIEKCQGVPFLTVMATNFNASGLLYKRILDLVGGTVGVILFFMMCPFVALAIKLESEGPVLFKQKRVGQHGRVFNLYKFRTMYRGAEKRRRALQADNLMIGAMFKIKDDPRITKVGRWLRKTSLDEFPQFLNVIRGEMSLVGTRPPMLEEVESYQPGHLKRIANKPGVTGLWQISGRNKITDFEQVVELDCKYMDNWSLFDDVKILFKTILVVLQRKGAI